MMHKAEILSLVVINIIIIYISVFLYIYLIACQFVCIFNQALVKNV